MTTDGRQREFHPDGHMRTGYVNCNKCGTELNEKEGYSECWFCGPVCSKCSYGCYEQNIHCKG